MDGSLIEIIETLNEAVADLSVAVLEDDRPQMKTEAEIVLKSASKLLLLLESTED